MTLVSLKDIYLLSAQNSARFRSYYHVLKRCWDIYK